MIDVPSGVYLLYGAANGIAFTGKVAQKVVERDEEMPPETEGLE
jgi:hypothetical protein